MSAPTKNCLRRRRNCAPIWQPMATFRRPRFFPGTSTTGASCPPRNCARKSTFPSIEKIRCDRANLGASSAEGGAAQHMAGFAADAILFDDCRELEAEAHRLGHFCLPAKLIALDTSVA